LLIDMRATREGKDVIDIVTYDAVRHLRGVREVLAKNGTSQASWPGSMSSRAICYLGRTLRSASRKRRTA
jgi:hypothetical protein